MKYILSISFFLINYIELHAQIRNDLVINGGFETLRNGQCVLTANSTASEYIGWGEFGVWSTIQNGTVIRGSSPDSYNVDTCGGHPEWSNSVPNNVSGNRWPNSGNGYIGFAFHTGREYPTGTFAAPLIPGRTYCAEMYVSIGEAFSTYGIKNVQMMLHTDSVLLVRPWSPFPGGITDLMRAYYDTIKPITFYSDFITDTVNWVKISTHFVADSAYCFFTIGNFKQVDHFDTIALKPLGPFAGRTTYLFLDDVSIYDCSDTIPPPEPIFAFAVKAYPNPASDWFNFDYTLPEAGKVRIHVTDVFGKIVLARTELQGQKGDNTFAIDATPWAMGRYHISVLYEANGRSEYRHLKHQIIR